MKMNPFFQTILMAVIRWALLLGLGYMARAGIVREADIDGLVIAGVPAILLLLWNLWGRYHDRVKFLTALTMEPGATENDVKAAVKLGDTPKVTTQPDSVPQ